MTVKKIPDHAPDFRVEPVDVISAFHSNDVQDLIIIAKMKNGDLDVACSGDTETAFKLMEEFKDNLEKDVYSA